MPESQGNGRITRKLDELDQQGPLVLFVAAALIALLAYLPTATYTFGQPNDARAMTVQSYLLGAEGRVTLPADWAPTVAWEHQTPGGSRITNRFPGAYIWGAMFYATQGDWPEVVDDLTVPYGPSGVAAVLATALGVGLMAAVCRQLVPGRYALVAALTLGLGTAHWSISANALWTHGVTFLFLTAGLLLVSRERFAWGGLAMGFSVLTRPQTALVPAVVGIWEGVRRRSVRPVVLIGLTSGLGALALVVYSHYYFGSWLPIAGYAEWKVTGLGDVGGSRGPVRLAGQVVQLAFHPHRGFFLYSLFLLPMMPALRRGWRASPTWVRSAAVGGVVYMLVQLQANEFHGGYSQFGYRLPLEMITMATPLLVVSYHEAIRQHERWAALVKVCTAGSIVLFALGATVLDPYGSEDAHEWLHNDVRRGQAEWCAEVDGADLLPRCSIDSG